MSLQNNAEIPSISNESTLTSDLEDLSVPDTELISGGPRQSARGGSSADDIVVDGRIITAENYD